jgi:NAD(P)-dependent dehydrogenase (short-subunit alcohol dehydrogenase family)
VSVAAGDVQRKVAIVTGGSQGTGAGLVAAYRRRGFAVVACSRSRTETHDSEVLAFAGDHADPVTAGRIVNAAVAPFGRVDTLIHDAGVFMPKPFTMHSPNDYVLTTGDKVSGWFHLTQRVVNQMLHQGDGGHVVTMTPTRAKHAYVKTPSALAAITEGGLIAATTSLAKEYARSGIRVNAVSPNVVDTPTHPDDSFGALAALPSRGQLGVIDEVVRAVLYLEAASHVTGEVLHLDGGHLAGY